MIDNVSGRKANKMMHNLLKAVFKQRINFKCKFKQLFISALVVKNLT